MGTNILAGTDQDNILSAFEKVIKSDTKYYQIPPLWDGKAGIRVCQIIAEYLGI